MTNLWRDKSFLRLWAGQTISEIGSRITREGVPMTAALVLGASTAQMGMLQALTGLATLIGGPLAGIVADRYRRKPIMIGADIGRCLVLALIPIAAVQGWLSMWLLFAVIFAAGLLSVFFDVAYQTMVPSMVQRESLQEANNKLALSASTAEMIGPAMTGYLIQWMSAPRAILLDSISFLVSAISLLGVRADERHAEAPPASEGLAHIKEGFRYVFHHRYLRPLAIRAMVVSFSFGFFAALYVPFAIQELGIKPGALGIVIAIGGVSNFFGAVLASKVGNRFPIWKILVGSTLVSTIGLFLIPLGRGPFWGAIMLGLSQLIGDISFPMYAIHELTFRQKQSAPEMLGRVNACMQMSFKGVWPLGALVGGLIAMEFGMRFTFCLSGLGVLSGAIILAFSDLRMVE